LSAFDILCCSREFVDASGEPLIVHEISSLGERLRQKLKVCCVHSAQVSANDVMEIFVQIKSVA